MPSQRVSSAVVTPTQRTSTDDRQQPPPGHRNRNRHHHHHGSSGHNANTSNRQIPLLAETLPTSNSVVQPTFPSSGAEEAVAPASPHSLTLGSLSMPPLYPPPPILVPLAATDADVLSAAITTRGHVCQLSYDVSKDTVRITRVSESGKVRTVLHVPGHMVINIESAVERDARQRLRQANDETVKLAFAESGAGAGLLCTFPSGTGVGEEDAQDPFVYAHSRVNTEGSNSGVYPSPWHPHQTSLTSPSAVTHHGSSPVTTGPAPLRYYIHYMRQRGSERPSIHTVEFWPQGSQEALQAVVERVVQRVYHRGPKHILIFISLKSGKGKGERIVEKHVRPVLHFSRHSFQTYVTTRAHDCEDYVANVSHAMNADTVLAAAGGDGMINELVNGLHRRKLNLVRWLRSVTTEVSAGSAAAETDDTSVGPAMEGGEPSSSSGGSFSVNGSQADPRTLATHRVDTTSATLTKPPFSPPGSQAGTFIQDCQNTKAPSGYQMPSESAPATARRIARRLVEDGWDALMPMAATIPAGSACGMAKSLDVLSVAESAMALVHLSTVHMDLLHMSFTPNEELTAYQHEHLSKKKSESARSNFAQYKRDHATELEVRAAAHDAAHTSSQEPGQDGSQVGTEVRPPGSPSMISSADATPPFLEDGSNVYTSSVDYALKMPYFDNRVAFMSLSFGAANDIDHGSEPLRWMGNARFHVYGGYLLLMGLRTYTGVLRYLPWQNKRGQTMEKLHTRDQLPSTDDFPLCTMREDCPHCQQYPFEHCRQGSLAGSSTTTVSTARATSAAATLAPFTDAALLDEDSVDFTDSQLPWVTIRGDFCIALLCNVRDVAQDMLMAPLAHLSDGAIDVVYCRIDPRTGKGGRMEMLKFFMHLEAGTHVGLDFVNYVKARAVEVKVDAGISMSDGELMPLSAVRMTKLRGSVQLVRSE